MLDILTHLPFWIGFASGVVCAALIAAAVVANLILTLIRP